MCVSTVLKPLTLVMHKNKVPLCVVVQQNEQMQQKNIAHTARRICNNATSTHYWMKKKTHTHTYIHFLFLLYAPLTLRVHFQIFVFVVSFRFFFCVFFLPNSKCFFLALVVYNDDNNHLLF